MLLCPLATFLSAWFTAVAEATSALRTTELCRPDFGSKGQVLAKLPCGNFVVQGEQWNQYDVTVAVLYTN
jgi:hypothetical protein